MEQRNAWMASWCRAAIFQHWVLAPVIGRTITPDDNRIPGGHPVAVLSYAYWQSRFAGDRGIVGKTITLNGHNFTVVGVAQKDFDGVDLVQNKI